MTFPYHAIRDEAVDNSNQVVKTKVGEVAYFVLTNGGAVDAWFHLYDEVTASVSVGTTTPMASFCVPAGVDPAHVGVYEYTGPPLHFEKGIIYAATTSPDHTVSTTPTVSPTLGVLNYR